MGKMFVIALEQSQHPAHMQHTLDPVQFALIHRQFIVVTGRQLLTQGLKRLQQIE